MNVHVLDADGLIINTIRVNGVAVVDASIGGFIGDHILDLTFSGTVVKAPDPMDPPAEPPAEPPVEPIPPAEEPVQSEP